MNAERKIKQVQKHNPFEIVMKGSTSMLSFTKGSYYVIQVSNLSATRLASQLYPRKNLVTCNLTMFDLQG